MQTIFCVQQMAARSSRCEGRSDLARGFRGSGHGDTEIGGKAIALPMTAHDGERYLAHVLPLTSGARSAFGIAYSAVAAVFVRKTALGRPLDVIAENYQLTPTELRVLNAIVERRRAGDGARRWASPKPP